MDVVSWFQLPVNISFFVITGETSRMYEANVDDVGYRLIAVYTPIREDGMEGQAVSASMDPISVGIPLALDT